MYLAIFNNKIYSLTNGLHVQILLCPNVLTQTTLTLPQHSQMMPLRFHRNKPVSRAKVTAMHRLTNRSIQKRTNTPTFRVLVLKVTTSTTTMLFFRDHRVPSPYRIRSIVHSFLNYRGVNVTFSGGKYPRGQKKRMSVCTFLCCTSFGWSTPPPPWGRHHTHITAHTLPTVRWCNRLQEPRYSPRNVSPFWGQSARTCQPRYPSALSSYHYYYLLAG